MNQLPNYMIESQNELRPHMAESVYFQEISLIDKNSHSYLLRQRLWCLLIALAGFNLIVISSASFNVIPIGVLFIGGASLLLSLGHQTWKCMVKNREELKAELQKNMQSLNSAYSLGFRADEEQIAYFKNGFLYTTLKWSDLTELEVSPDRLMLNFGKKGMALIALSHITKESNYRSLRAMAMRKCRHKKIRSSLDIFPSLALPVL